MRPGSLQRLLLRLAFALKADVKFLAPAALRWRQRNRSMFHCLFPMQ